MKRKYKLYCECKNEGDRRKILREVTGCFPEYTVYDTTGVYKGAMEASIVVELITESEHADIDLLQISKWICCKFDQECVLVTCENNIHACEIGASGIVNQGDTDGE